MKRSWLLPVGPSPAGRSWLLELALGCLGAAVGCWFLAGSISEGDGAPVPVEVVAGVVAFGALVLFRRRHPLGLTLVLVPAGIVLALPMGFTPIALFAVGLHRRARVTVAVTALHTVAVATIYLVAIGANRLYLEVAGFLVLLHVLLASVAMLIRSQRMLVRSWADRAREAEEGERLRVEQARLAERERIAREMHDSLAHRISLLAVHAGALEVRRDAPEDERQAAAVVRQGAYDALEDLRGVIKMLREPSDDRPQPALADVPALVEESREAGTRIDLTLTAEEPVPAGVGRHAYRIVQEALTNARKHAPGAKVTVAVTGRAEEGLLVEVGNGRLPGARAAGSGPVGSLVGAGALPGAGAGLVGLRERVQLAGGRLEHGPTDEGHFRLRAWLPWHP